ncbi:MAG: response regulator of the LytR/AlgR family [Bacillales bacterium]|jgi:DNA-binding LytR/AlgR family response regulator|nr:response regulator of the LytR/AlgR family [Bacillales bacterium]
MQGVRGVLMKIELKVDPNIEEKIIIQTKELTSEVQDLIHKINNHKTKHLAASKDQKIYLIDPSNIFYFYTEGQKILAKTDHDIVQIKLKLYEIEEQLKNTNFIRISNSVIANIDKIKNLEMTFNGTLCINFKNGDTEYSSRRYVSKIKYYLGL